MNKLGYAMGQQTIQTLTEGKDTTFSLLDLEWDQLGAVFGGEFMYATAFFTSALPLQPGSSFLEMGCGSGVTAVMAALRGCAPVVAVDVNPAAAENVTLNAKRHGVGDRVRALTSNLFRSLDTHDRFDIIYWNSPFIEGPPGEGSQSYAEAAVFDPEYRMHREFLQEAPGHLNPGGSVFLGFSELVGNMELLRQLADTANMTCEVHQQQSFDVPHEQLGTAPEFAAHADEAGLLHPDFTLLRFRLR